MNDVDRKRELRRKETNDKEKNKLLEIEKEIRCRIIDLSYRKLKERVWIGIEEMCGENKEEIIRKHISRAPWEKEVGIIRYSKKLLKIGELG
jgi:hypothetical protein